MSETAKFIEARRANLVRAGADKSLANASLNWMIEAGGKYEYSYNFSYLGRPIIQYPTDMVAIQELIWEVEPDLIIETGIAHGGSLVMSAAMLSLLDYCEAAEEGTVLDPANPKRKVLGIDVDIRAHNRRAIESHPMHTRIEMFQGSSIDSTMIQRVTKYAADYDRVLVCLDSNHTHAHVLAELEAYAPLVSVGSYCVVFDTLIEDTPGKFSETRPWGPGDNPKTAVHEFLRSNDHFQINREIDAKLLISVAPEGFLLRSS